MEEIACTDPGIFARGVQARVPAVTFFFHTKLILKFYSGLSMVYLKENYNFPRFQWVSNIFQWRGPTFSWGGGNVNVNLYRNPYIVSKGAKIRNRYNQVPHLTQDTNGKVTNSQKTPQTGAKRSALSQQLTTKHI